MLVIDCGSADQRFDNFDERGRDCLWETYTAGESTTTAKWKLARSTIEGDPISYAVVVTTNAIEMSQDTSADKFAGSNKGVTTWRCSAMTRIARSAGSFTFAFSGCTGGESPPPPL
jgi:hypothetical protein